jgi:hypothetical protein
MKATEKQIEKAKINYANYLKFETLADYKIEELGYGVAVERMEFHNDQVSRILAGDKGLEREWKLFFLREEAKKDQKKEASNLKKQANKEKSADVLTPIKQAKRIVEFGKWLNTAGNVYRKQNFTKSYTQEAVDAFLGL